MNLKDRFYGPNHERYHDYDTALSLFKMMDYVAYETFNRVAVPKDFDSVFQFLESEGFVVQSQYGIEITEKGKCFRREGGFVRRLFIERLKYFSLILGIFVGIVTLISFLVF